MQYKPRDKLDDDPYGFLRTDVSKQHPIKGGGGGGVQGKFFGGSDLSFGHHR